MNDQQQNYPPGEPGRSLRFSIWEGGAYTLMASVTGSSIRTFLASQLGATDADFSAITALGTIATLGAVFSSQAVGRIGSRRKLVVMASWLRVLWAALAVVPLLALQPGTGLNILIAVVFAMSLVEAVIVNGWMSWMTDLTTPETRSRYFGLRNSIHAAIAIAASWGIGHAFDFLRDPARLGPTNVFVPLFLFAAVFGALSAMFMGRKWEPPMHDASRLPLLHSLLVPFAHADFRRLLRFHVLWTLVTAVSTPFWQPHMISNLHMNGSTIAIYSILSGVAGLASQLLWGRLIDRHGCRPVLVINLVGITFLPLFWLFARADFLTFIWIDAVLTGLLWPGFNLAVFSLNLQTAPRENRQAYLAAITVTVGVTGFLASLLGGWIATATAGFHATLLGFPLINYHIIFVLSTVGRLATLPLALRLPEERSHPVLAVLTATGQKFSNLISDGVLTGIERIKKIAKP